MPIFLLNYARFERKTCDDAAKKLKAEGVDPKKFADVKLKIDTGYYNSVEVIDKVADEIIKEFNKEN